jgi:hypothetical protein
VGPSFFILSLSFKTVIPAQAGIQRFGAQIPFVTANDEP